MAKTINLRPIQTGDASYLTDHHNRDGECIITVTMSDSCSTAEHAQEALFDGADERLPSVNFDPADLARVARWCATWWQDAQDDMSAQQDRDTDGDDSERYLECHMLATWEA